jgi:hypothetical protein
MADARLDAAMGRTSDGGFDLKGVDPAHLNAAWNTGSIQLRVAVLAGLRDIVAESERQPSDVARIMEEMSDTLDEATRQGVRLVDVIRRAVFQEADSKREIRLGAARLASEMARQGVEVVPAADALLKLSRDPDPEVRLGVVDGLVAVRGWGVGAVLETGERRIAGEIVKTEAEVALQRLEYDTSPEVIGAARNAMDQIAG